jgi:hypothetical protein
VQGVGCRAAPAKHIVPAATIASCLGVGNRVKRFGYRPHTGLQRGFRALKARKSATLSVETPLCPYSIGYRGAYGSFTSGLHKNSLEIRCVV